MDSTENQRILAKVLFGLLILATIDFTVAQTGVCYGRLGSGMPSPSDTIAQYNRYNIQRMRLFDPHTPTLQALGDSNIEVMLGIPNHELQNIATNQANANTWVENNVLNHRNVRFRYIAVGNEVSPIRSSSQYVQYVVPAMSNIYNTIRAAGLEDQIRVSTALETGLLGSSYPPSAGAFNDRVTSYVDPIIQFLASTGSPVLMNIYPFFSYIYNPQSINISYALGSSDGIVVNGVRYENLFDASLEAVYAALGRRPGGSSLEVVVSESGWPTAGEDPSATVENARIYNTNLIQFVRNGTPRRPGQAIVTYIFAMFDENNKTGDDYERNFGLFRANGDAKYPIRFN